MSSLVPHDEGTPPERLRFAGRHRGGFSNGSCWIRRPHIEGGP